jgi:hypothetical protein
MLNRLSHTYEQIMFTNGCQKHYQKSHMLAKKNTNYLRVIEIRLIQIFIYRKEKDPYIPVDERAQIYMSQNHRLASTKDHSSELEGGHASI